MRKCDFCIKPCGFSHCPGSFEERSSVSMGEDGNIFKGSLKNLESDSGALIDGGGLRLNSGKPPIELVSPEAIYSMARALDYGAKKYAKRNWERGMDWSIPYACLMRHLMAWFSGEDRDAESGLNHLDHVLANAMMLAHYNKYYLKGDDRPSTFHKDEVQTYDRWAKGE